MTSAAIYDYPENRGHDPTGDCPQLMSTWIQTSTRWWALTNAPTHTHTHYTHNFRIQQTYETRIPERDL